MEQNVITTDKIKRRAPLNVVLARSGWFEFCVSRCLTLTGAFHFMGRPCFRESDVPGDTQRWGGSAERHTLFSQGRAKRVQHTVFSQGMAASVCVCVGARAAIRSDKKTQIGGNREGGNNSTERHSLFSQGRAARVFVGARASVRIGIRLAKPV